MYTNKSEIDEKIDILIYAPQIEAIQIKYLDNSDYFIVYLEKLEEIDIIYQIAIDIKSSALIIWIDN